MVVETATRQLKRTPRTNYHLLMTMRHFNLKQSFIKLENTKIKGMCRNQVNHGAQYPDARTHYYALKN